jgi:predicted RNase H-like HicB family nuclease/DNA-binding XRE family transcriptional regulator
MAAEEETPMKTYRTVYERDPDGWWIVDVPDVAGCHTQGRSIEQARRRVRDALAVCVGVKAARAATLAEEIRLPKDCEKDVEDLRAMKAELIDLKLRLAKAEQRTLKRLRHDARLGQRDAGEILGVSFQRVHQLEKMR